jgi:hypothetical protein
MSFTKKFAGAAKPKTRAFAITAGAVKTKSLCADFLSGIIILT